ncbi:MAG: ribosome assembly RNA-binding protein YhbY [Deltaproteobacteria bacterium]
MELTAKQRQYLRALAHAQKPLVQIGTKGVGESVIEQIRAQLQAHELVKIRFNTESAVEPEEVAADLALQTKSQLVQQSGRVVLLYRRHDQRPKIELPKRARPAAAGIKAEE